MSDYIYVNIYNEGVVPWLGKRGPLFGYKMGIGTYYLLRKDPRINMKVLNSLYEAEKEKKEYLKKLQKPVEKEPIILHDEVNPIIDSVIVETVIPESVSEEHTKIEEMDDEIDNILADIKEDSVEPIYIPSKKIFNDVVAYSEEELNGMTKLQMKNILKERGYTSGPMAGKYHDTVDMLKEKVRRTQ